MARLDERRVKRLAVEADEDSGSRQLVANHHQQLTFIGVPKEHELTRHERAIVGEPATADEKRQCAGAPAQTGRFKIEEHHGWLNRTRGVGELQDQRCLRKGGRQPRPKRLDSVMAVLRRRLKAAVYDKAAQPIPAAPLPTENLFGRRAEPVGAGLNGILTCRLRVW